MSLRDRRARGERRQRDVVYYVYYLSNLSLSLFCLLADSLRLYEVRKYGLTLRYNYCGGKLLLLQILKSDYGQAYIKKHENPSVQQYVFPRFLFSGSRKGNSKILSYYWKIISIFRLAGHHHDDTHEHHWHWQIKYRSNRCQHH